MKTVEVRVKKIVEVPNNYEVVPYNPDTVIEKGWKFYDENIGTWADTHSVSSRMEFPSGSGTLTYIRPIFKDVKAKYIPRGIHFFWAKYPGQVFLRHSAGFSNVTTGATWENDELDEEFVIDGYIPVNITVKAEEVFKK